MRFKLPRELKSKMMANLIIKNDLYEDWRLFRLSHQKIKSLYKLGSLFCNHRHLRWITLDSPLPIYPVTMDSLDDYWNDCSMEF